MTSVRIATLNLWNVDRNRLVRLEAAAAELTWLNVDVVALQEVGMDVGDGTDAAHWLAARTGHEHTRVHRYADEPGEPDEGLAFLARAPLRHVPLANDIDIDRGLRIATTVGDLRLAVTNVHLDWRSALTRERQIVAICAAIDRLREADRYEVLLGDFNAPPISSVGLFLDGQASLAGRDTVRWHDLAAVHAAETGTSPGATLDFRANPRWRDAPTLEQPARIDRVLLRDVFDTGLPSPVVRDAALFGTTPQPGSDVVPSDHYGVVVELDAPDS